jgi:hypothetical protein
VFPSTRVNDPGGSLNTPANARLERCVRDR